jgi:YjbR protein
MMTGSRREWVLAACCAKPGAVEDYPFGDEVAVFKVAGRMFALVPLGRHRAASASNVILIWRLSCAAVLPGSRPAATSASGTGTP